MATSQRSDVDNGDTTKGSKVVTNYSNPFMSLTEVENGLIEVNTDKMNDKNLGVKCFNPFLPEIKTTKKQQDFASTNPFVSGSAARDNDCFYDCDLVGVPCHHQTHSQPMLLTTNPFSSAHMGSFAQSTPISNNSPHSRCADPQHTIYCNPPIGINPAETDNAQTAIWRGPYSKRELSGSRRRQPSSDSEDDYEYRERVPTLRPGQYDGSTPWNEFLHRFESCSQANCWSEKTMTVQLKFCLVGPAGAIVHRNPRSSQWDYRRLVREMEMAYGPSSEHAAAVAIELRQRVRKPGEPLHTLRDDIYGKVSVAYSDRTETEQDAIGVEVFTNAVGDSEIVQKLLEQRPLTLAQAYDIARRYETTKRAASYVTNRMHPGARNMTDRRPHAAVIRGRAEEEATDGVTMLQTEVWGPEASGSSPQPQLTSLSPNYTPRKPGGRRDIQFQDFRCHNCSGLGHMRRDCPSRKQKFRIQDSTTPPETSETVFHLKAQDQEMNIRVFVHDLEVCAVLDSGARRNVFPLHLYNTIPSDVKPPLQPSKASWLIGVGPGNVPVLGEAHVSVRIDHCQVNVLFLVADIATEEILLGHPFLAQAQARLDFGNHRIVLFGEEVPYFQARNKPKEHAHIVRVARSVVLGAGQEYLVRGHTRCREQLTGDVMLSPTKGFMEKHKLLVARVIVAAQPATYVPLRIYNPGSTAVTIKRGAVAGLLHPAEALLTTDTDETTTSQPSQTEAGLSIVPQHLQELYTQLSLNHKSGSSSHSCCPPIAVYSLLAPVTSAAPTWSNMT